jgi:hypothetical protein
MSNQEEYSFFPKKLFDDLANKYLEKKSPNRRRKTFISCSDYDLIISVLREPNNTKIGTAKDRNWIKGSFHLRELGTESNPNTQVVTIIKNKNEVEIIRTVCPFDRVYDILCKIHASVLKHVGATKMWDVVGNSNFILI